jgi:hypothetical protein
VRARPEPSDGDCHAPNSGARCRPELRGVSADSTNSYAWTCSTNGALSADQRRVARAAIRRAYVEIGRGRLASMIHRSKTTSTFPSAPDSAFARLAEEAAADRGPTLAGHGYRTWVIGDALAGHDGFPLDPELFYVASLLHDSGMTRQVVGEDFTIRSARTVLDLCGRIENVDDEIGPRIADAIVGHASPGLSVNDDEIAFYVQAGAMADLAVLRMWDLPRGYLSAAYAHHPACGVHRTVPELIRREARDVPDGRFAVLRSAGMDRMVQFSPTRRYRSKTTSTHEV